MCRKYNATAKKFRVGEGTHSGTKGHPLYRRKFPAEVPKGAITQAEVKSLLPPSTSCWQGTLGAGSWNAHYAPYSRVTRAWSHNGHYEAAMWVLRAVWRLWLADHSLTEKECPIKGMF